VELHPGALEQAQAAQRRCVRLAREEDVQRRDIGGARRLQQRFGELRAHAIVLGQQSSAGGGRERHRRQQLRVVGEAVALVGVGPGPVEHVLAVRMRLHVERHRARQPWAIPECQVLRRPAARRRRAAAAVKAVEECMGEGGVAPGERVPTRGVDAFERLEDAKRFRH
jgi:hypothetical protein